MRRWLVGLLIAALAVVLLPAARASAAPPTAVYFTQTGHNLGEPFLTYWRTHGGLAIYGYPLTEPMQEVSPYDNKPYTVQYFERARLEAHPENPAPFDVELGQLGRTLADHIVGNKAFTGVPACAAVNGAVYFPQTQHILKGAFLDYWENNGGLPQFGYPLSEEFVEKSTTDGKLYTVQYFERNRFELHNELPDPYKVLLGLLGSQIAQQRGIKLATAPRQTGVPDYDPDLFKPKGPRPDLGATYVEVNLSQQHLYAWQDGEVIMDTAVSTGRPGWETPPGTYHVFSRLTSDDMTGGGPPGSPDYYYQPAVPWVQYFLEGGYALHGNYWNLNFGTQTSHGCVGMPVDTAHWLYDWGYIGLPVWVHY
ncbi:MAG: L,D-transpeptidase [Thermomicrobiales bacterium]